MGSVADDQSPSLAQALAQFLSGRKGKSARDGHQELNRFIQWCGRDRTVDRLTPSEVANYSESAGLWGSNSAGQLKLVKSFLTYLKDKGHVDMSLAPSIRVSKSKKGVQRVHFKSSQEQAELSQEGYDNLQARLEVLKGERVKIVGDIQRAMADKDFRENAPLDAAKERQGMIESGIKELESILSNAVVSNPVSDSDEKRVRLGTSVILRDLASGKKAAYTVVDSREANPTTGRISSASPVGKALLDKLPGEEVEIAVPKGTLRYVIETIEG
jgi:transcription elongation factor GreA